MTELAKPKLRQFGDTEEDAYTAARIGHLIDLALSALEKSKDTTEEDILALLEASRMASGTSRRLLNDFHALHEAGAFAFASKKR